MKKLFFLLAVMWSVTACFAQSLDEQEIQTEDKKCAIHYLTSKPKNLWSMEVNSAYCHDGWVHGFAPVVLKDSLKRTARTLEGYFHKGYWLSDFTGELDTFYRVSPDLKQQDFIFQVASNQDLDTIFYLTAHAEEKDGNYGPFDICPQQPVLVAVHQPTSDFKESLFQSKLMKEAQKLIISKCPATKKFTLLGVDKMAIPVLWMLRADINLQNSEINLTYRADGDKVPRPSELRRETGENLLTVPAQKQPKQDVLPANKSRETVSSDGRKSAVDLALSTQALHREHKAKVVVYVAGKNADYSFSVTRPFPLLLQSQEMLSPGWYLVEGIFQPNEGLVKLQALSVTHCLKEWCLDDQ